MRINTRIAEEKITSVSDMRKRLDQMPKQITVSKDQQDDLLDLLHEKGISYQIDDHPQADGKSNGRYTYHLKFPKYSAKESEESSIWTVNLYSTDQDIPSIVRHANNEKEVLSLIRKNRDKYDKADVYDPAGHLVKDFMKTKPAKEEVKFEDVNEYDIRETLDAIDKLEYFIEDKVGLKIREALGLDHLLNELYKVWQKAKKFVPETTGLYEQYGLSSVDDDWKPKSDN